MSTADPGRHPGPGTSPAPLDAVPALPPGHLPVPGTDAAVPPPSGWAVAPTAEPPLRPDTDYGRVLQRGLLFLLLGFGGFMAWASLDRKSVV